MGNPRLDRWGAGGISEGKRNGTAFSSAFSFDLVAGQGQVDDTLGFDQDDVVEIENVDVKDASGEVYAVPGLVVQDADDDYIGDSVDNCVNVPNLDQVDADSDGAGVACDPDDTVVDFDQDSCTDGQELGIVQALGGRRDPTNPWDFYDTDGNKAVDLFGDIFGVAAAFGQGPGDPDYSAAKDRSPPPSAAEEPDPTKREPWDMGPPDGTIDLFSDIFGVASQFGHSCT